MSKPIVTSVINKQSGIMDILRTNIDSSIKDQVSRQLEDVGYGVVKVTIETEFKKYNIEYGVN